MRTSLQTAATTEKALAAKEVEVSQLQSQLVQTAEVEARASALDAKVASLEAEIGSVSHHKSSRLTRCSSSKPLHPTRRMAFLSPLLRVDVTLATSVRRLADLGCPRVRQRMMRTRSCAASSISSRNSQPRTPS